MQLSLGTVVVTEGGPGLTFRLIRWATGSTVTHCFVVTGANQLTEAHLPWARTAPLDERLAELARQDRAAFVLDYPDLSEHDRQRLAETALKYQHRAYDILQIVTFGLWRRFGGDVRGSLICSRLVTRTFKEALNIDLFDPDDLDPTRIDYKDLLAGQCSPDDLLHSKLKLVAFLASSRITHFKGA